MDKQTPLDTPNIPFDSGVDDFSNTIPRAIVLFHLAGTIGAIKWLTERKINFYIRTIQDYRFLIDYDLPRNLDDRDLVIAIHDGIDGGI